MVLPRWCYGGKPYAYAPHQQCLHRLYTPTLDGFERLLREMIGLEGDTREGSHRRWKKDLIRRKEK
jgi:hypothetical protein